MSDALDALFGPPFSVDMSTWKSLADSLGNGRSSRANRLQCQEIEYRGGVFSRPSTKRLTFFYRMANT